MTSACPETVIPGILYRTVAVDLSCPTIRPREMINQTEADWKRALASQFFDEEANEPTTIQWSITYDPANSRILENSEIPGVCRRFLEAGSA